MSRIIIPLYPIMSYNSPLTAHEVRPLRSASSSNIMSLHAVNGPHQGSAGIGRNQGRPSNIRFAPLLQHQRAV